MSHKQPLSTENYQYKLDEQRRERIQQQFERERMARLARVERPVKSETGGWAQAKRIVRQSLRDAVRGLATVRIMLRHRVQPNK